MNNLTRHKRCRCWFTLFIAQFKLKLRQRSFRWSIYILSFKNRLGKSAIKSDAPLSLFVIPNRDMALTYCNMTFSFGYSDLVFILDKWRPTNVWYKWFCIAFSFSLLRGVFSDDCCTNCFGPIDLLGVLRDLRFCINVH